MTAADDAEASCAAVLLSDDDAEDRRRLDALRRDPTIEFIDHRAALAESLRQLRPAPAPDILAEPARWAYYPWRRTVVGVLGPRSFRALRLDRNRNLITTPEQESLRGVTVGVAGLSVGHAIAHTLAAQGVCGAIRLADFDLMELSNLNRVPATVLDLGVNKAVVAARRIAELDPYLDVEVLTSGLTPDNLDAFIDGLDVVVDECDSLAMKLMIRERARLRRLPVVMATSDRGLVDIERFDLEPARPIFHGLLGDVDSAALLGRPNRDNIAHMLRHLDASQSSRRFTASLVEMDKTLATWPQLAGDVVLGAAAVVEAVRRISLNEPLSSGQIRIDIGQALEQLQLSNGAVVQASPRDDSTAGPDHADETDALTAIAEAAVRAPSGGNSQPWTIRTTPHSVLIALAPEHTSTLDVGLRGSAVAVGAAAFNARVAAAALHVAGPVVWRTSEGPSPLEVELVLGDSHDAELASLYAPVLHRETNRRPGTPQPIDADIVKTLMEAASREGAQLRVLAARDEIDRAATILAAADRIRYLTPRLHEELFSELRWPGDEPADSGIDIRSLELDPGDLAVLDILKRSDVMALLAEWDAGERLGDDTRDRLATASALGVITVSGSALSDFARGGSAAQAVWVIAQQRGLAVQPLSPAFLHAVHRHELTGLSATFAEDLRELQEDFRRLVSSGSGDSEVLILRFAHAQPASVKSRRRQL